MDIFGIGFSELVFILIIAMMIFGPRRLPEIAAKMGKFVADMRRMSQGLMTEWQREIAVAGRLEEIEQARKDIQAIKEDLTQAKQELGQAQKDIMASAKVETKTSAPPKPAASKTEPPKTAEAKPVTPSATDQPLENKIGEPSAPAKTVDKPAEAAMLEAVPVVEPAAETSSPETNAKKKPRKTKAAEPSDAKAQENDQAVVLSSEGSPGAKKKPRKTKTIQLDDAEPRKNEQAAVLSGDELSGDKKKPGRTKKAEAGDTEAAKVAVSSGDGLSDDKKKPRKTKATKPAVISVVQPESGADEGSVSAGKNSNGAMASTGLLEPAVPVEAKENVNE